MFSLTWAYPHENFFFNMTLLKNLLNCITLYHYKKVIKYLCSTKGI